MTLKKIFGSNNNVKLLFRRDSCSMVQDMIVFAEAIQDYLNKEVNEIPSLKL